MENKENNGFEIDRIHDSMKDNQAEESYKKEIKLKSPAQEILMIKILKSSKLKDSEYQMLKSVLENNIVTTYDASIFIEYVLSLLKFRRTFFSKKHKSYKKCNYCGSRDNIQRMLHIKSDKKIWVCETCELNLDSSKFVHVKFDEDQEVKADLHRKYDYSPEQEILDEEIRHPVEE